MVQVGFSSEPDLHTLERGLLNLYNYFVTGEENEADFFLSCDTCPTGALCYYRIDEGRDDIFYPLGTLYCPVLLQDR